LSVKTYDVFCGLLVSGYNVFFPGLAAPLPNNTVKSR
jgi:hypothetical protein